MGSAIDPGDEWIKDSFLDRSSGNFSPIIFVNELAITASQMLPLVLLCCHLRRQPATTQRQGDIATTAALLAAVAVPLRMVLQLRQSFKQQEELLGISAQESEDLQYVRAHKSGAALDHGCRVLPTPNLRCAGFQERRVILAVVESMDGLSACCHNELLHGACHFALSFGARCFVACAGHIRLELGRRRVQDLQVAINCAHRSCSQGAGSGCGSGHGRGQEAGHRDGDGTETDTTETDTERFDRQAFAVLLPPIAVLVVAYTAYTLVYEYHRGWLSWAWAPWQCWCTAWVLSS